MTAVHVWIVIAALLGMGFPGPGSVGAAEIYFWTDENGVPHFSNVRPEESAETPEKRREIPADPAALARREAALREAAARRAEERRAREIRELKAAVRRAEMAAQAAERHAQEARRLEEARKARESEAEDDRYRYRLPIGAYRYPPAFGQSRGHAVLGLNPLPSPETPDEEDIRRHPRRPHSKPDRWPFHPPGGRRHSRPPVRFCLECPVWRR
jgi:hypothetical protein